MSTKIYIRPICLILALIAVLALGPAAGAEEKFHGAGHSHGEVSSKARYDSLFNEAVPLAESADGSALIDRCLKAYGGQEHLEKLNSVRLTWRMLPMMSRDSVDVIRTAAPGRRYSIFRQTPGGYESRMMFGNEAWFQTADTLIPLNSGRYKAELFSYLVLRLPLSIKSEPFNEIRFGSREGDSLQYIFMAKTDSLMIIVGIDPDDFMIKRAEGVIQQGEQSFVFENHFADHRKYGDFIFPSSLINISMGLTVGQSILKKAEVNFEYSDSDFMPQGVIGD